MDTNIITGIPIYFSAVRRVEFFNAISAECTEGDWGLPFPSQKRTRPPDCCLSFRIMLATVRKTLIFIF